MAMINNGSAMRMPSRDKKMTQPKLFDREYLPAPIIRTPTSFARFEALAVDRFMKLIHASPGSAPQSGS
jgi:hypothetical protein